MIRSRAFAFLCVFLLSLASSCKKQNTATPQSPPPAEWNTVSVKFANLPYADHTYSSIGVAKGWFKEVGIDLQAQTIKIEDAVPSLSGGTFDVVSIPPGILFSAHDTAPDLCTFVFGDLFQGYALMAQPNAGYKSYSDLRKQGMSHSDAVKATVGQMRGKTFAYPSETAVKPFIDFALAQGGMTRDDVTNLVLDDPLTVNAMRQQRADFQVGGVPSRLALQKEGFVPILSSVDLAMGAKASAESKELASILQNGWAVRKDFYEKNHATVLRLASVNYRIMEYMQTHREEAIAIHMAYLTKATGQKFTAQDGSIIYDSLDPFVTFEDQRPWFEDKSKPLYYAYVNGAILNSFLNDKVFKKVPPTVDDVIFAAQTYQELEKLKQQSDQLFSRLAAVPSLSPAAKAQSDDAKRFYDAHDYYDSQRLAASALDSAGPK